MKLEQQVVSLELAKELKKAGYKQEGLHDWLLVKPTSKSKAKTWVLDYAPCLYIIENHIVAPTVAELGEAKTPKNILIVSFKHKGKWTCQDIDYSLDLALCRANTEANARAKMRLYLIKKGLI